MTRGLVDEILHTYGKNIDAIGKGVLDQRNYVALIEANCTLLHAHALLKVAEAIKEAALLLGTPVMKVDIGDQARFDAGGDGPLTPRDKKLQADCDHVDAIERGVSSLMMALENMGFNWKTGEADAISEYGLTYEIWSNGNRKEGDQSPRSTSITEIIGDAIAMFSDAYAKGSRFIVWRIAPEITSHQARKNLSDEWYYKLYFRYHFLPKAPPDFVVAAEAGPKLGA